MSMISSKNNIKELRKQRGLTQRELADICGLSCILINRLEEDRLDLRNTKMENVIRLCKALKCNIADLFKDKDSEMFELAKKF